MAKRRWYTKHAAVLTVLLVASGLTFLSSSVAYAAPTEWSPPVNISNSGTYKHPPSIAVDINGNIHVVWFEDAVTPNIVYTKWDGASWSTPTVLNQGTVGGRALVADSLGHVHLIYIDPISLLLHYRVLNKQHLQSLRLNSG